MKRLSESVFDDIITRSKGNGVRKEDKTTNINDLTSVDMGGSILWADKDLTLYDENYFNFEEAKSQQKQGWRLPTLKEVSELNQNILKPDKTGFKIISKSTNVSLYFPRNGFIYTSSNLGIIDEDLYYGWTSDIFYNTSINIFTIDEEKI